MNVLMSYMQDTSLAEANSFSPSMTISPSSMINQYKFEDEPELRDLFITVDDPESHITAIETFITYRVITKVSIYSVAYTGNNIFPLLLNNSLGYY